MTTINLQFVQGLTLKEKAALVCGHDLWYTATAPGIKKLMMTDGPSGLRKQTPKNDSLDVNDSVQAICFPASSLTACSFDDHLLYQLGEHLGVAANAEDIGILLGPGVNIKRSPLGGRNFEYFSEDPLLAGRMATAYVKGVQSKGVGVSVKHFAANNRENQRFTNSSNMSERTLREIYLSQFERIVKQAHPAAIMCSYNRINGHLNSQNQRLLTEILRNEWGFDGIVMSDWGAVANHTKALRAGLDLEMPGKGQQSVDEVIEAVNKGYLDEAVLDQSVLRVLATMKRFATESQPAVHYDKKEQHDFARTVADNSIVLLKNEQGILPLTPKSSIAVIGALAQKPRYEGGGSSHVNAYKAVSPLTAAPKSAEYATGYTLENDKSDAELEKQAIELATTKDRVVIFAGFPAASETEGFDKTTISLPNNQVHLIKTISKVNPNVVVVLQNGSVVEMPWADRVQGIVETYLAGEAVGEATWDILLGKVNPSGKLPETFPIELRDNPTFGTFGVDRQNEDYHEGILVGYRYYDLRHQAVRFPFGFGLSYTTFKYSNLKIKQNGHDVDISFDLTNTGNVPGKEVAQVYINNHASQVVMPVKELRDFKKVNLNPNETKTINMTLPRRAFTWFNSQQQSWEEDNGTYSIMIGSSSRDIRLMENIEIKNGVNPVGNITSETYVGDVMKSLSPDVKRAMKESGLYDKVKPRIDDPKTNWIFANMPFRSLAMTGIDQKMIDRFLRLVK